MADDLKTRWIDTFQDADVDTVRGMLARNPGLVDVPVTCILKSGKVRTWSPLNVASSRLRSLEKARALVAAGASLHNSEYGTHWPSEEYAINAYFIARGIDVNQPSFLGFHAIGVCDLDSFYLILDNGLDPNYAWPCIGETLLHVQCRHDDDAHLARSHALIRAGADVNARARSGLDNEPILDNEHFVRFGKETPLHFAARLGNLRQVRLLLRHGADPATRTVSRILEPKRVEPWPGEVPSLTWPLKDHKRVLFEPCDGETPLDMAEREGHSEIAALLKTASG